MQTNNVTHHEAQLISMRRFMHEMRLMQLTMTLKVIHHIVREHGFQAVVTVNGN